MPESPSSNEKNLQWAAVVIPTIMLLIMAIITFLDESDQRVYQQFNDHAQKTHHPGVSTVIQEQIRIQGESDRRERNRLQEDINRLRVAVNNLEVAVTRLSEQVQPKGGHGHPLWDY